MRTIALVDCSFRFSNRNDFNSTIFAFVLRNRVLKCLICLFESLTCQHSMLCSTLRQVTIFYLELLACYRNSNLVLLLCLSSNTSSNLLSVFRKSFFVYFKQHTSQHSRVYASFITLQHKTGCNLSLKHASRPIWQSFSFTKVVLEEASIFSITNEVLCKVNGNF